MKIKQITENTTSGSIATVDTALGGTQSRGNPSIYGGKKVGSLFKGKKTKAPYANSINESAELSEAHLEEDDIIVVPGQGRSRKNGFVPHGKSRVDHEVEMARSDLFSAAKNAKQVYEMIQDVSEEEGLDGWVQEKIIKANDYLNTIREYLEGKQVQSMAEQTIYEGMPADNDMGTVSGTNNKMTLGQWKQMWQKKMPNADMSLFRFPPSMSGSAIAYFDGWENTPAARWDPQKGVTENNQRGDSLVTDSLKIMKGGEVSDAVKALKTVLGDREYNSRRGFYNFYIKQMIDMYGQQGVAEADMNRRGFLKGIGAAMAGAAGIGAASNSQARAPAQWLEKVEQTKELLAKGFTPDQIAKKLGVTGPNNGMAGPMNGDWGAINYAVQQVRQVRRTGMQEGSKSSNKNKKA